MFQVLAGVLAFFYGIIPNYAVAIALLTLTVMLVLSPLTLKSTRSMLAMQRLQPEVKRIQQKYKGGDRQQMQQEMMALYKEHQVNPVSGCLPMLVQLPVLFVMYHVIRGLIQVRSGGECPGFDPKYLGKGTRLFQDLCHSNREMNVFGLDLAKSASQALKISLAGGLPFLLLTASVAFVQYYQSRQMTRRNPQGSQSPQVQMMTRVMPVMFGVFSFAFPAALNVYWLISGLFRVSQQGAMYRWDPTLAAHVRERTKEVEAKAKDSPSKQAGGAKAREGAAKAGKGKDRPARDKSRSNGRSKLTGKSPPARNPKGGAKSTNRRQANAKPNTKANAKANGKASDPSRSKGADAKNASSKTPSSGGGKARAPEPRARKRRAKRGR